LELNDLWGTINSLRDTVHRVPRRTARPDARVIAIGVGDLFLKSNYQNFQRYFDPDLSIAGDAQTTLPSLIEAVRRAIPRAQRSVIAAREEANRRQYGALRAEAREAARYGWDASPISTARLAMELWNQIKDKD